MAENLWVEKYRPRKIEDCILTNELKETFKQFVNQKELPNLLLSGTAGTGKTTVARALCEELGCDYIIINGSDPNNAPITFIIIDYPENGSLSVNFLTISSLEFGFVPLIEPISIGLGKKSTTASNKG